MPTDDRDWYLRDWLQHSGKIQASLVNELDWNKAKASLLFHSKQQYRREDVNEVAGWLGIEPFELLMSPQQALALRRLKSTAADIVADADRFLPAEPKSITRPRKSSAA